MAKIIVIHGTPGAGKGTNSKRLVDTWTDVNPIMHISAGDRIREIALFDDRSQFTDEVRLGLSEESLNDELVNRIIFELIEQAPPDATIILDGYPTKIPSLEYFFESIEKGQHSLLGIILLEVSEHVCKERISKRGPREGNEKDVSTERLDSRFRVYNEITIPTMDLISEMTTIIRINAEFDEDTVWQKFQNAIYQLTKQVQQ